MYRIQIFIIGLVFCACTSSKKEIAENEKKEILAEPQEKWSYVGETGPNFWSEIEKNSECNNQFQSPVNINTANAISGSFKIDISDFHYENVTQVKSIHNNGHTIEYDFEGDNNALTFDGDKFLLKQFHFHSPSEHTFDGVRYPLELHMVHYNEESGKYVVFSLMAKQGLPSKTFDFLEQYLPIEVGETKKVNASCHLGDPFANITQGTLFYYKGSLTTPPCTEKVSWFILKEPLTLSEEQIKVLKNLMPLNNYRGVQPLNNRKIEFKRISN